jgi:hypothetical protein
MTSPTLYPRAEAATHLGISQAAVRRRLKAGKLHGERRISDSGFQWWVAVDGQAPTAHGTVNGTPPAAAHGAVRGAGSGGGTPDGPEAPGATTTALLATRAQEMAEYTRELLAPLHARLEAQAELIGVLKERLAASEARVAALEAPAPQTERAPSPGWEARRWWQRLLFG